MGGTGDVEDRVGLGRDSGEIFSAGLGAEGVDVGRHAMGRRPDCGAVRPAGVGLVIHDLWKVVR